VNTRNLKVLALILILLSTSMLSYSIVNLRKITNYDARNDSQDLQIQPMTWINVTKNPSPPILAGDSMIFDTTDNQFLLFGGQSKYITNNELWLLDASTLTWKQLNPSSPLPAGRADPMFVRLSSTANAPTEDQVFLFGGWYNNSVGTVGRLADSWYYFPTNNTWQQISTHGAPSGRSDAAVAYDPEDGYVLMYGGYNGTSYLSELWTYYPQNTTWIQLPRPSLPPLADARMQYDTRNHLFIMFGGNNNLSTTETYNHYNTTWTFRPSNHAWTQAIPSISPPARDYAQFAYNPDYGLFMLQGGYDDEAALADTWLYSSITHTWVQLQPPISPPARFAGVMDYASSIRSFVLFGGGINDTALNDTWVLQYAPLTTAMIEVPTSIHVQDFVQFSTKITNNAAIITAYLWTFGDGTNSSIASPNHTYTTNGTYEVRLTVTDVLNESFNATLTLKVLPSTAGIVVITLFAAGVIGLVAFVAFLSLAAPKKRE
jgi:PKD domain-containing protein/galactose oxidase-like protein